MVSGDAVSVTTSARSRASRRVRRTVTVPPPNATTLRRTLGEQALDERALARAERRLALLAPQLGDALAGGALDLLVGVDERHAEARGEARTHGALARAHEAAEDDGRMSFQYSASCGR